MRIALIMTVVGLLPINAAQALLTPPTRIGLTPRKAAHIFVIRYDGVIRLGEWGYEETGLDPAMGQGYRYQAAILRLTVEEELRGRLVQHRGLSFELPIHWIREATKGLPNIWVPHREWKPGTRLLALCDGSSDDATVLLIDRPAQKHCEQLSPNGQNLEDVRVIVDLEQSKASLDAVLRVARTELATRGSVFAWYVGERLGMGNITDQCLATVLDLVPSPNIEMAARDVYLQVLSEAFSFGNTPGHPPHPAAEIRWIRTLFRLVSTPPASLPEGRRDTYARAFLMNAIGLYPLDEKLRKLGFRPTPFHSAEEVFSGAPEERAAAIVWVRNHAEVQWKLPLLDWLQGSMSVPAH